jgi:hypothetical protein
LFFAILPTANGFWASFLWPKEYLLIANFVDDFERRTTAGTAFAVALAFIENGFLRPGMWQTLQPYEKNVLTKLNFMGGGNDNYDELPAGLRFLERKYPAKPVQIERA